jgi:tripartite-type tricarboxylate transporter receptor subunit TctC
LIGRWLSERLGQPFIIENRPGGGANIGTEAVVRARRRGYTLLVVGPSNAINATLYDKLNFDFLRDIAPVAGALRGPYVLVVNPSVSTKSSPSSSLTPRPILASSPWRRVGSEVPAMWPASY